MNSRVTYPTASGTVVWFDITSQEGMVDVHGKLLYCGQDLTKRLELKSNDRVEIEIYRNLYSELVSRVLTVNGKEI